MVDVFIREEAKQARHTPQYIFFNTKLHFQHSVISQHKQIPRATRNYLLMRLRDNRGCYPQKLVPTQS